MALASLLALILAGSGCGSGNTGGGTQPPPTLSSIAVTPATPSVTEGSSQQFRAEGTYSDSSAKDITSSVSWTSSKQAVATIASGGMAQAVAAGATTITAALQGVTSNPGATLTVTAQQAVAVAVSPTSASVPVSGTQQFTATVTGSSNTAVTWSVNGSNGGNGTVGTVSSSGLYTAPVSVPNPATVTVTATSQADSTKSDSASVTISAANTAPVITGTSRFNVLCNVILCPITKVAIYGSDFTKNDLIHITPKVGGQTTVAFVNSGEWDIFIGYDTASYDPGQFTITITRSDGSNPSNPFTIGMTTNRNVLAQDPTSKDYFLYEAGAYKVHRFKSDGTFVKDFTAATYGMAMDSQTGLLVFGSDAGGITIYDQSGNFIGGDGTVVGTSVAASNGMAGVVLPSANEAGFMNIATRGNPLVVTGAVFDDPCAPAIGAIGSKLFGFVYSCGNKQVAQVDLGTMTVTKTLQLSGGVTEISKTAKAQLVFYPASGTLVLVDPADTQAVIINASAMTLTQNVALTGTVYSASASQSNGKLVVVYNADPGTVPGAQAVPTKMLEVDVASGVPTQLADPPAGMLPLGINVGSDGSIALGERGNLALDGKAMMAPSAKTSESVLSLH